MKENDYGFSVVDDAELITNEEYSSYENQVNDLVDRLKNVEGIILPFLNKLMENSDKPLINWPNRKPIIEQQIQKILSQTRVE